MAFSIARIVAIAFTVGSYNCESIPALPSGVTLNALISILSTAARAALFSVLSSSIGQLKWCWLVRRGRPLQHVQVLDEASRGPLGAIRVLATWTGGPLASLGAVITICMIAFSPFLQQLVTYPTNEAEDSLLKATILRASDYALLWDLDVSGGVFYTLPWGLDSAGFLANEDAKDGIARQVLSNWIDANEDYGSDMFTPSATCPRPARCTWENYKSIGWCSKCRKATGHLSECVVKDHRVQRSNNTSYTESFCRVTVHDTDAEPAYKDELMRQYFAHYNDSSSFDLQYKSDYVWAANISTFVADDNSVIEQPVILLTHAAMSRVKDTFRDLYNSDQPALRIDHITECVLTLCEREYVVKTENRDISSTPVSTDYGRQFQSESDSCWRPNDSANEVVLISYDGGHTRVNETERVFCPVSPYYHYFSPSDGLSAANNTQSWHYNLTRSSQGSDNVPPRPAAEFVGEMNRTLETLATLLTNFGQNVSNHNAIGKALLPVVTVHVRWQWISLPAVLELASAILFLSTVFYSRHLRVPIWKSSLLAIYYHQIEDLQEGRASLLLSDMDKASNDASVQIFRSEDARGFMLRRVRDGGGPGDGRDQE